MNHLLQELIHTTWGLKSLCYKGVTIQDLSNKETITLLFIHCSCQHKELSVKTIGDIFKEKTSSTVQTLNKLEEKKLIQRVSSEKDKRISVIQLTPQGENLIERYMKASQDFLKEATQGQEEAFYQALKTIQSVHKKLDTLDTKIIEL